ncbi:MAG: pentapeptide repeat-containing protein [Pseudomonadales bacterium]
MSAEPIGELRYWLDSELKNQPNVKEQLEAWAASGHSMANFNLRNCQLGGINLVNHGHKTGFDMSYADLYRADLRAAHLFNIDLSHASLMKADLRGANLHCANLSGCNLLGAKLDGAKLDHVIWPEQLMQETQAKIFLHEGATSEADDYYEQAEETYRNLRIACEGSALFETAGNFFYREMVMRRHRMPKHSIQRLISHLVDLFCGYGEKPVRVIFFSMSFILVCACLYFLSGINGPNGEISVRMVHSVWDVFVNFFSCLYFSVVTFTTLGYGDFTPDGFSRFMAALEAFTGSFTMALFVVVFVKKMTR